MKTGRNGGLAAGAGYDAGQLISNKLFNVNTHLGFGDYVNMAKIDGASFLATNGVALISKLYTMGPTIVTSVTRGVSKFVGNWVGGGFNEKNIEVSIHPYFCNIVIFCIK